MKRWLISLASLCLLPASFALAQDPVPDAGAKADKAVRVAAQTKNTGNLSTQQWLYVQEQERHDDPQLAVRRNAEERARQRRNRIESRKWFGLSNARPQVCPIPTMDQYSPAWSGNGWHEFDWLGIGWTQVATRTELVTTLE